MRISGGSIDCYIAAQSPTDNYVERQHHNWALSPSPAPIDDPMHPLVHVPYTWTVTGHGSNSMGSWTINGSRQQYFQTKFDQLTNTVSLIRGSAQGSVSHGITGTPNIDNTAWEIDYLPSALQWSSTRSGPFVGRRPAFLILFESILGRVFEFREQIELPAVILAGANDAPSELLEPAPRNNVASWSWEIDF